MKNRHELEYPSPGAEFSAPGTEFTSPGTEFTFPGQEFAGTSSQHRASAAGQKRRWLKKKVLYLAVAFLSVANLTLLKPGSVETPPVETQEAPPAETQPMETQPTESVQVLAEPQETLTPPPTYPLGDGIFDITVYNETFDLETGNSRVLYRGSFPEADFTELRLPEPEPVEGFGFVCFVMYGGRDGNGQVHYYRLQDTVTAEDITLVAPEEDGVRYVEIYAAWQLVEDREPWMPLTLDGNGGTPTVQYDATGPMASGGRTFLCAYPVPERPGYQFAGWYEDPDCSGDPVEVLGALAFFQAGEDGIDWSASIPITLYARWLPD